MDFDYTILSGLINNIESNSTVSLLSRIVPILLSSFVPYASNILTGRVDQQETGNYTLSSLLSDSTTNTTTTTTTITTIVSEGSVIDPSLSCDVCGWIAAFCAMIAFGTFAVPIKSKIAQSVNIDPLVFQTYKTFMCFITSWIVLVQGEKFTFTPWGIVSGLFWVPAGVATVFAVKAAGLAIGIGIGSSCIVLVSFIWGIFIFEERVNSKLLACTAIVLMIIGLFGMSYFSSTSTTNTGTDTVINGSTNNITSNTSFDNHEIHTSEMDVQDNISDENAAQASSSSSSVVRRIYNATSNGNSVVSYQELNINNNNNNHVNNVDDDDDDDDENDDSDQNDEEVPVTNARNLSQSASTSITTNTHLRTISNNDNINIPHNDNESGDSNDGMYCCYGKIHLTKRQLGMCSAAFCGLYGGSILVPMKYAPADAKGTHYLISFSIGATIITIVLWIIRLLINTYYYGSIYVAYRTLPSFHIRVMWLPGSISGLLWSIGNYFSLLSVLYLGEGVGYPLVQTSIIISGLWGIFYFKEIQGYDRIVKWLLSSIITIIGILLLSYEHHK